VKAAGYRLIIVGLVPVIALAAVYFINGSSLVLGVIGALVILPFSLIFLVLGILRLIQSYESEADKNRG
jgi:uncharacterized Tic20 family protein